MQTGMDKGLWERGREAGSRMQTRTTERCGGPGTLGVGW